MAAGADRLAAALAYEDERKRRLAEVIPTVSGPTTAPRRSLRTDLENLSAGVGQGLTSQLQGIKSLVTDPVGTAKTAYEAITGVVRDPSVLAAALTQMGQKAMSGPLGAGEVIGEMIGPRKTAPVMAELDVYHGTPHKFPATEANPLGEFDASKIGTGEGAQAYGHGVYLAESPDVAKEYQVRLSYDPDKMRVGGKQINDLYREIDTNAARLPPARASSEYEKMALLERLMMNENIDEVRKAAAEMSPSTVKWFNKKVEPTFETYGALYKADLPDEMIDRMLDWDKPLSEQPKAVQNVLMPLVTAALAKQGTPKHLLEHYASKQLGGDLVKDVLVGNGRGRKDVSELLRQAGIPGIKYLDAGSRGQGGSGTRNFVVFPGEEKKVRILERK